MCGMGGIVGFGDAELSVQPGVSRAMVAALRHRGPDEFGMFRDRHAVLVHARLSIIDLAGGSQPMQSAEGDLWVSFNGEIFNYVELRAELEQKGYRFRTSSDTEVLVTAFQAWGPECFRRFNGQWAVAIWNPALRQLVLSRDRVGVRPLYMHRSGSILRFASEVKALFADSSVRREMNPGGLDQILTYWSTVAPVTPFVGVEQLQPGHIRVYGPAGEYLEEEYWRPSFSTLVQPRSLAAAAEVLRAKLTEATRLRMVRADVPVGSYLSGGLDSSVIARLGREACPGDFRTFSVRFEDAEFDETEHQRAMAATLDSRHEEIVVCRGDIARVFPDVIRHAESPILRTAPAPLFLLSRLVRRSGIKAVLTGEGADEFVGGYDLFKEGAIRRFWARDPGSAMRPKLFDRMYPYLARSPRRAKGMALEFWRQGMEDPDAPGFSHGPRWRSTSALKRFYSDTMRRRVADEPAPDFVDALPPEFASWDPLGKAQYLEIMTLMSGYLLSSQGDRMLMANSVEGRFPFLDVDVMEFCDSLPATYKLAGLKEKVVLKEMAKGLIPETIIRRSKQPYRAPDAACFFGADAPDYVGEMLSPECVISAGLFDPERVRALAGKCAERVRSGAMEFGNSDNMALVGILSAQLTHSLFISHSIGAGSDDFPWTTMIDRTVPVS